jgi:serine/threonine protein kinase
MKDAIPVYDTFPADVWVLGEVLGHGGQGHTLFATHASRGERVALKRLHARHLEDLKHLELFVREAEVLRALDHPDIPRCVDVFFVRESAGPAELYLAQTFIEGRRLDRVVKEGPLPDADTLVGWLVGLLDVLTYLHTRLPPVVHRDVKPSNILIRPNGSAALVDFGAVATGWAREDASTLVGTPGYAPPEQLAGIVGPRADLFALGATAWHVVTGRAPQPDPDSGALAIPDGLDARLARFIRATTALAPSGRPATAAAAKALLTHRAPPAETRARSPKAPPSPGTPVEQLALFKDFGPPPRVLEGVLREILLATLPALPAPPPPPPSLTRPPARGRQAQPSESTPSGGASALGALIVTGLALPIVAAAIEM